MADARNNDQDIKAKSDHSTFAKTRRHPRGTVNFSSEFTLISLGIVNSHDICDAKDYNTIMPPPNRNSKIQRPSDFSAIEKSAWHDIWNATGTQCPFLTFQFSYSAEKSGCDVFVAIIYADSRIIAFFPYQFSSPINRLIGRAERVGGEMNDYCGLIAVNGVTFNQEELMGLAKIQTFQFSHLHHNQLDLELPVSHADVGHLIRSSPNELDYWQELKKRNKKLTQDTARCISKFEKEIGPLIFQADIPNRTDLLDTVIQMKREQYRRTDARDALAPHWRRQLMQILYRERTAECHGMISAIFSGTEPVAIHFGLVAAKTLHYWFPVYNTNYSRYSPGRLLYKYIIDSMPNLGLKVIDHGAGDANYKIDLSNESYKVYAGRWSRDTPLASLSIAATAIEWRMSRLLAKIR